MSEITSSEYRIILVEGMSDLKRPATELIRRVHNAREELEPLYGDCSGGLLAEGVALHSELALQGRDSMGTKPSATF